MHAPFEMVSDLLSVFPKATEVEDKRGKLPLHWALQTKASMKNINALFETFPAAAKSVSLDLDYKIIQWQSEQEGMPVVERKKIDLALFRERVGHVEGEEIQGQTQLNAGHDGAHHRAPWNGSDNFGLSKFTLTEWSNHNVEGNRKKKIDLYASKKNTYQARKIVMIHSTSNRCKFCWCAQMDQGEHITGEKFASIAELIQHFDTVHNVEARVKPLPIEHAAKEQAAKERAAKVKVAREHAAIEQAAREQVAREEAAKEKAAREQAARVKKTKEYKTKQEADRRREKQEEGMVQPESSPKVLRVSRSPMYSHKKW